MAQKCLCEVLHTCTCLVFTLTPQATRLVKGPSCVLCRLAKDAA